MCEISHTQQIYQQNTYRSAAFLYKLGGTKKFRFQKEGKKN